MKRFLIFTMLILSFAVVADDLTGVESLKKSLEMRSRALDGKDAELRRRERELNEKESLLAQQLDRYEKRFQEMRQLASTPTRGNQEDAFKKIYEKMDARKIARVLEDADVSLVGDVLGEMRPQIAAEILGRMSNEKVRLLTQKYLNKRSPASKHR